MLDEVRFISDNIQGKYIIRYEMKTNLLSPFESIPYFTLEGFKQFTGMEAAETVRVLLHRWAKAGHILPLKKGVYMARRFYEQHRADSLFSAAVSAILLPQSYLSLEFILQQYNLLTEVTYPITCITTKNTRRVINPIGTFWYRNLRADLYRGFTITEYFGISISQASVAKALFDHLYLRALPAAYRNPDIDLAEELRLNLEELSTADREEFSRFVAESRSRKMMDILNNFRSNVWQP
jgi:predicted transcriptional regulator of viral defense system